MVDFFVNFVDAVGKVFISKNEAREMLKIHGLELRNMSDNFRNDRYLVHTAVKQNGLALEYASDELKNDIRTVTFAYINNTESRFYASATLQNKIQDHSFFNESEYVSTKLDNLGIFNLKGIFAILSNLPDILRNDYELILKAVKKNGDVLQFASDDLKNNYNIVMEAVKQNGNTLKYASDDLKNNENIVIEAVKKHGKALRYASDKLKSNYSIVMEAVRQDGYALQYASNELKNTYDIVMEAVKEYSYALEHASDDLKNNYDIVIEAVERNGRYLQYVSPDLIYSSKFIDYFVMYHSGIFRKISSFSSLVKFFMFYGLTESESEIFCKIVVDKQYSTEVFGNELNNELKFVTAMGARQMLWYLVTKTDNSQYILLDYYSSIQHPIVKNIIICFLICIKKKFGIFLDDHLRKNILSNIPVESLNTFP